MEKTQEKTQAAFNINNAKKVFNLSGEDIKEINGLIDLLHNHILEYADFKSFIKTCKDALTVATALLNGDKKTFKKFKLKYTTHTAQKMKNINSLSTYKKTSDICKYLSACAVASGGICARCYAEKSIKLYKSTLAPTLIYNTLLLKYTYIDNTQIDFINDKYFRFEAFSDLQSAIHFKNLITICKKNKNTIFTLWTKAGYKLIDFMKKEDIKNIPANMNIILSEFYINKSLYDINAVINLQNILHSKNALKVFCVYDSEEKRASSGFYLCKNSCATCLKCYEKSKAPLYIAEKLH